MAERAVPLSIDISVADAEELTFDLDGQGALRVRYIDWREAPVELLFQDVAGVRWQEHGSRGPEERDDMAYEILDSGWLAALLAERAREPAEGHRHFKLCFNVAGPLEVLATGLEVIAPRQRSGS